MKGIIVLFLFFGTVQRCSGLCRSPSATKLFGRVKLYRMSSTTEPVVKQTSSSTEESKTKNPEDGSYDYEYWKKAFVSQPKEFDYSIPASDIEGKIPVDLQGTLFRNRPALFERGTRLTLTKIYLIYFNPGPSC